MPPEDAAPAPAPVPVPAPAPSPPVPPAPAPATRQVDAVRFRLGWAPPGWRPTQDIQEALDDFCRPLLGSPMLFSMNAVRGDMFVVKQTPGVHQTMYFPVGSPLEGVSRYEWEKQESGCEFGYLVDAAKEAGA